MINPLRPITAASTWSLRLLGLSIVLPLAVLFRFWELSSHVALYTDQARTLLAGRNILFGELMLTGPSTSVQGIALGPLYYYLTALSLWFTQFNPIGPVLMVTTLSTITVIMMYFFVQKYWGWRQALLASTWLAISPLAIEQGRLAVEPSPLPLVTLWWLWSTVRWVETRNMNWLWSAVAATWVGVQLNFSAAIWGGVLIALFVLMRKPWAYRTRLEVALACGAAWVGLFLGKLWWSELTSIGYLWEMWQLITVPNSKIGALLLLLLTLSQLGYLGMKLVKHVTKDWSWPTTLTPADGVLGLWIVISVAALGLKTIGGYHALNQWFVLWPLLLAGALEPLFQRKSWQTLATIGVVIMTLAWSMNTWQWLQAPPTNTVQDHSSIVSRVIELSQNQPYNLVYRGHLDVYDAADDHYQYLLWWFGNEPTNAARIDLIPEYREAWLHPEKDTPQVSRSAPRTLYLYVPAIEVDRYAKEGRVSGTVHFIGSTAAIEVRE